MKKIKSQNRGRPKGSFNKSKNKRSIEVQNDLNKIDTEDFIKKDYYEPKKHVFCRDKEHRIHISICDRDCLGLFCNDRLEIQDSESWDYLSLNGKIITKAEVSDKTKRDLWLYLDDKRIIKIGYFNMYNVELNNNESKTKIKKKEIRIKLPINTKRTKIRKINIKGNKIIEKTSSTTIIKKKLKNK
jgi:hypothetical protein